MSIVLIDSYSQIYRNFYAVRMLNNPKGEPVNALFGMVRLLIQLDKSRQSDYGAFVFDKGKAAKRLEICPEYKAQRPPMPDDMRPQIEPIRQWIRAFGWSIQEQEGLEADDIIAAISRQHGEHHVTIVTGDKDISQLTADASICLAIPTKGDAWEETHADTVCEKFGVPPELLGDYLALVGDTADNITGLHGIGPKTAASLLNSCGSLEKILADTSVVANEKLRTKLEESRELIARNRKLVALDNELPQGWNGLEDIRRREPDWTTLISMAESQGFKSILTYLKKQEAASVQPMLF